MKAKIKKLIKKYRKTEPIEQDIVITDNGHNNTIDIEDTSCFKASQIVINGNNNQVNIAKNRVIRGLSVVINGNNKSFIIDGGVRNIVNLKFESIRGSNQEVRIGKNFSCGGLQIRMNDGDERCFIGDDCLFSWDIKIRTSDGHSIVDLDTNKAVNLPEDVLIGDRVWCCEEVSFLKGSRIANDCVIGTRALITKSFTNSNVVIAGSPAKIVKHNIGWHRDMPYLHNEKQY
ncbi:acyltransferase [Alteromonas gracilis]|uniref:acyltransferase n=1 Tax=Alteromonas gracilis TaxID=1479524 RepID=UPI0030CC7A51